MAIPPESVSGRSGGRRVVWIAAAVVLTAGLAAHWIYWYGTRTHAASADADVPLALLESRSLPLAVWVAYPHQNAAALARGVGDPDTWMSSVARLLGVEPPKLRGFGPFRAPPARELCVASDPATHRMVVVARVYPAISVLARLAGLVASNPWLAGGDVTVSGRPARVGWRGTLWWVATDPALVPDAAPPATAALHAEPALARVRSAVPQGWLPAGSYALAERDGALELRGGTSPSTSWPAFGEPEPLLFVLARGDQPGPERGGYLLWPGSGDLSLPGLAAFRTAGARAWRLPGGGAADLLGGVRDRVVEGGWAVSALDAGAAERALALAPELGPWLDSGRPGAPSLALRIDLAGTSRELHRLNRALAAVPLLSRRETERWLDAERALQPLVRFGRLELLVAAEPSGARLRLGAPPP